MRVLVASGPTREPIDPVRYISNRSAGVLGQAIVQEAHRRGHRVAWVTGPVAASAPKTVRVASVETALQMQTALRREFRKADLLVMAAAVADFRAQKVAKQKRKRGGLPNKKWTLTLVQNPDIIAGLARMKRPGQILIGFALETQDGISSARAKLKQKQLDAIVLTKLTQSVPFGHQPISGAILDREGSVTPFHRVSKQVLARRILSVAEERAGLR
ncbi:MAG: hypothetical protein HY594_03485 [Candidatus Omnitrophica bacterium]|nr:hypothetical protein [Candidatus Omnitrophota bacterium]